MLHFIMDMLQFGSTELKLTMTIDFIAMAALQIEIHDMVDFTIYLNYFMHAENYVWCIFKFF